MGATDQIANRFAFVMKGSQHCEVLDMSPPTVGVIAQDHIAGFHSELKQLLNSCRCIGHRTQMHEVIESNDLPVLTYDGYSKISFLSDLSRCCIPRQHLSHVIDSRQQLGLNTLVHDRIQISSE